MKIKTISRTVSFGNYENIGMTAELNENDDISGAMFLLEQTIKNEIEKKGYVSGMANDVERLKIEKAQLQHEVDDMQKTKSEIESWCTKHNLPISALSELPF